MIGMAVDRPGWLGSGLSKAGLFFEHLANGSEGQVHVQSFAKTQPCVSLR